MARLENNNNKLLYYSEYYGEWSSEIAKLVAVKHGLKPLAIFKTNSLAALNHLKKICKENKILFAVDEVKKNFDYMFGTAAEDLYCIYASRDNERLLWAASNLRSSKNFDINSAQVGLNLGYPVCCVANYSKQKDREINYFSSGINEINLLNNNLLSGGKSNSMLFSHNLCSYNCRSSIEYARKLLDLLKKQEPGYYRFLSRNLRKPILLWRNDLLCHNFLYSVIAIVLNGSIRKNTLDYKGLYVSVPLEPSAILKNHPSMPDLISLSKGNRLLFNDDILVYDNDKFLHKIERGRDVFVVNPVDEK